MNTTTIVNKVWSYSNVCRSDKKNMINEMTE
jgi:hypothetical protein